MTSSSCPTCGHVLVDGLSAKGHNSDDVTELLPIVPDISSDGSADRHQAREPVATSRASRPIGLILLAVGAAVIGLIVGSLVFAGGTDTAERADDTQDTAGEVSEAVVTDTSGAAENDDLAVSGVEDQAMVDSVSALFLSAIDDGDRWSVVYPSPMGLQVLNSAGTTQPAIEVAAGFEEAARFPLISDGSTSWAVNPAALDTAYLVSTQFVVIDIDLEGRVAFINDSLDPPNIGESSFGAWGPGFDLPSGAEVLAIPRRGLFVLPSTGGTYEYEANGVIPFSDDVLVAASSRSEVFERCNDTLECELYVVTPDRPEGQVLDLDVRSEVWLSPDGEWLVVRDPDGASTLRSLDSGETETLPDRVRSVDWAADGSRAALLSDETLTMFFVDSRETVSVTLPIAPSASAVLLVSS